MKKIYSIFLCLLILISLFDGIEVKALDDNRTFYNPNDEVGTIRDIQVYGEYTFIIDENNILWAWLDLYKNESIQNLEYNLNIPIKLASNVKELHVLGHSESNITIFYLDMNNNLYRITSIAYDNDGNEVGNVKILDVPTLISNNVKKIYSNNQNLYYIDSNNNLFGLGLNSNDYYYNGSKINLNNSLGIFEGSFSSVPIFISANVKDIFCENWSYYFITLNDDVYVIKMFGPMKITSNVKKALGNYSNAYVLKNDGKLYDVYYDGFEYSYENIILDNVKDIYSIEDNTFFALTNDNRLFVWGDSVESGINTSSIIEEPTEIFDNIASLEIGIGIVYALTIDSNLFAWGSRAGILKDYEPESDLPSLILNDVKEIYVNSYNRNLFLKNDKTLWAVGEYLFPEAGIERSSRPVYITNDVSKYIEQNWDYGKYYFFNSNNELYTFNQSIYDDNVILNGQNGYSEDGIKYQVLESTGGFGTPIIDNQNFSDYATLAVDEYNGVWLRATIDLTKTNFDTSKCGIEVYRSEDGQNFRLVEVDHLGFSDDSSGQTLYYLDFIDYNIQPNKKYYYSVRLVENYIVEQSNVTLKKYGKFSDTVSYDTSFFVSNLSASINNQGEMFLSWLTNTNISGYDVYQEENYDYVLKGSTINNTFKLPVKVDFSKDYNFKVIPYKLVNGYKTYGMSSYLYRDFNYNELKLSLSSELINSKSFHLTWSKVYNTKEYELYRRINGGEYELLYSGLTNEYVDNIEEDVKYLDYKIEAISEDEDEFYRAISYFEYGFDNQYDNQLNLQVSNFSPNQNKLEWYIYNLTFHILRSEYSDFRSSIYLGNTKSSSFIDKVSTTSKKYYYMIYIDSSIDDFSYIYYSRIVESEATPVENKINLSLDRVIGSQIDFSWNPVSDYIDYEVSYSVGSSANYSILKNTTDLSFNHTGLLSNTEYKDRKSVV